MKFRPGVQSKPGQIAQAAADGYWDWVDPPEPTMKGALSPAKAAEWLDVSEPTIYRLMRRGALTYVQLPVGGRRIPISALEALVDPSTRSLSEGPSPSPAAGTG